MIRQFNPKWIKEGIDDSIIAYAKELGTELGTNPNKMNPTQIRKFYGEVKRQGMREFDKAQFVMQKPRLAYAVARADKKNKIKTFYTEITKAMDCVNDDPTFRRFIHFFEAIVAYHKAAEEDIQV